MDDDDAQLAGLMTRAQDGDGAAYERLLRACLPRIAAIARGEGLRGAAVDDAVQETLLTLHRARHTYDPSRPFLPWLRAIARRRAVDGLRRDGRRQRQEVQDPSPWKTIPTLRAAPRQASWPGSAPTG